MPCTTVCYSQITYMFFFECYVAHRALHSFPTRRSSDLRDVAAVLEALAARRPREPQPGQEHQRAAPAQAAIFVRSEEHTSELQSRRDLVCRLLLEKKKIITEFPASEG